MSVLQPSLTDLALTDLAATDLALSLAVLLLQDSVAAALPSPLSDKNI
jgi:hypothetical protein